MSQFFTRVASWMGCRSAASFRRGTADAAPSRGATLPEGAPASSSLRISGRRRAGAVALALSFASGSAWADVTLLNVSYDPTRELYKAIDAAFAADWKAKTRRNGDHPGVARRLGRPGARRDRRPQRRRRHAGARRRYRRDRGQDRQDPRGLAEAAAAQFRALHVHDRLPGPQRAIRKVSTTGTTSPGRGSRWSRPIRRLRAAHAGTTSPRGATVERNSAATKPRQRIFVTAIYRNAPVLDTGARGSTITFAQRGIGDVLIAWENDAFLASEEFGKDQFEIVTPSHFHSRRTAGLDRGRQCRRERHAGRSAEAYLQYLYTPPAQAIIAKNYFRPTQPRVRRQGGSRALPQDRPHHC